MSKRNRREHGRIISVETLTRGDALAADVAAGATSISVNDAGDFDEDGGWLYIGAQTVEYTACDDDTGVITLATALTAAGEQGDPVQVWSDLYGEVVDYQQALVELDGEYDNPDPVVAEVAEGVEDLPEGDRGKAGESCTLLRVADDEWEIVGVGGRSRRSRGIRWEWDDAYTLTAGDIGAGVATFPLSHRPIDEAVSLKWRTVPQEPTEYAVNYDAQTITYPLTPNVEAAGDRLWVHYAYRKGIATATITSAVTLTLPLVGVAGSTLDVSNLTSGSVVGTGQVWNDASDATYVNYSSGNARSPIQVASPAVPSSGYTVEVWIKTTFTPSTSGLGVSIWQGGFGTLCEMPAGGAVVEAGGWLRCPQTILAAGSLVTGLNGGTSPVAIIGSFAAGQVYEAYVKVWWDA